jgi:hypothetical protein
MDATLPEVIPHQTCPHDDLRRPTPGEMSVPEALGPTLDQTCHPDSREGRAPHTLPEWQATPLRPRQRGGGISHTGAPKPLASKQLRIHDFGSIGRPAAARSLLS